MRPIKFRARNADLSRCWIYGYFVIERGMYYIINDDGRFQVIVKTESQFTGLLDKNGKEIWEGDIVKWMSHRGRKEIFIEAKIVWGICGFWTQGWLDKLDLNYRNMEVIGNIYENPELLKD